MHLWQVVPFLVVLVAGVLIFIADYHELAHPLVREIVLSLTSLAKSVWFLRFVIRRIRHSANEEFYFHEFIVFIALSTLLFVLSYAIDFYCLYQIRPDAFQGLPAEKDLLADFVAFFYFSVTNFTTAGLGDIVPATTSARFFIASELIISFFFTILILANLGALRDSFARKK